MKNIELLRHIKAKQRKELVANFLQGGSANMYSQGEQGLNKMLSMRRCASPGELINISIIWSNTPQGHAYWERIKNYY
jgi:hypothetical protein